MCNTASKVFFWDLARLEEYHDFLTNLTAAGTNPTDANTPLRPSFLVPFRHRNRGPSALSRVRDTSPTDSTSTDSHSHSHTNTDTNNAPHVISQSLSQAQEALSHVTGLSRSDAAKSLETWAKRYAIGDPFEDLAAHKEEVVKGLGFVGRQIAWSRGGEWCVVVGSAGVIGVFERWRK
jgi:polycomb protein EED